MIKKSGEIWFLDSGCSNHVIGNQIIFEELNKNYSSHAELGDGKHVKIEGNGVIAVHTSQGNKQFIHDVHYSPNISQNLLSVGQIMKRGYKLIFGHLWTY